MLVFFVLLGFVAEGLCQEASIAKPMRLCPKNEIYKKCRTLCPPQFCNASYTTYGVCDPVQKCEPGCDCIENYLRDFDGICVLNDNCPPPKIQCGENQEPSDCADDYSADPQIQVCRPGCRCIEGYSRNTYNECVPRPPVLDCCENEEPSTCKQTCPPQTCDWDPTRMACKAGPCQPGCNCIKGYLRDCEGNCIPQEKCPPLLPQCGENEEPTDCARNIGPCDSTLTIKCRPCQCIQGYERDSNGVCVSTVKCTGKYEVVNPCPSPCFTDACGEPDPDTTACNTLLPYECVPRCWCQKNYRRDSSGNCVPIGECPSGNCTGKYEVVNPCPAPCFTDACGEPDPETTACNTLLPYECEPRCWCQKNYRRDSSGNCIPIWECPNIKCGVNQMPSDCADDYSANPRITLCRPGCRCIEGYARNTRNECVPRPPDCGKNEEPSICKQSCPPQTCSWDPTRMACRPGPCQPGCNCIKGYLRDCDGNCIPQQKCPPRPLLPQCGKNEEPTDCARNIGPCDSTLTIKCRPCQCIQGYERDSNGVCVSKTDIQCGENEEPSECKQECPPQTCAWDPVLMDCRPVPCKPGCNCVKGYLRDEKGNCIPQEQCPQCRHEPNTFYTECPNQCTSSCKNPNGVCSVDCGEPFGCKCIPGYIKSDEGRCILPDKCPGGNPCGKNGTYVPCYIPCPTNNCPKDDSRAIVACSPPYPCPGGCACKSNYTRVSSEDRRCILATDCRPIDCTRKGEVYNSCPPPCYRENCGDIEVVPKVCYTFAPHQCRPQCVCRDNYRRNRFGVCIPIEKCPPQCGKYEEQTDCTDYPNNGDYSTRIRCVPGCKCIAGYQRDRSGECVPTPGPLVRLAVTLPTSPGSRVRFPSRVRVYLSPITCTGKYEVVNPCPAPCFTDACGEPDPETTACNTLVAYECEPRCWCQKNYRRDSSGNCIPIGKCPAVES